MPLKERVILFLFILSSQFCEKDNLTVWSRVVLEQLILAKLVRRRSCQLLRLQSDSYITSNVENLVEWQEFCKLLRWTEYRSRLSQHFSRYFVNLCVEVLKRTKKILCECSWFAQQESNFGATRRCSVLLSNLDGLIFNWKRCRNKMSCPELR